MKLIAFNQLLLMLLHKIDASSWIADLGATEHITDQRHWFTTFHPNEDQCWRVTVADNHLLYVHDVGDIIVHATVNGVITPLTLHNVLYVPHLRRNLISTGRLTENRVAIVHVRDECKMISRDGDGVGDGALT